jgi:hypothetical protein
MSKTHHPRRVLKSIGAVIAGMLAIVIQNTIRPCNLSSTWNLRSLPTSCDSTALGTCSAA